MASPKTIGRLQAQIHRRIAHCLQFELADPRASFVTVTKVELSKDLARAKISYSVLGSDADRSKTEHMLAGATGFVRRQLGRVLETRTIPALVWNYDPSAADAANLTRVINEARRRDEAIRAGHPTPEFPDGAPPLDAADEASDEATDEDEDPDEKLADEGPALADD